MSYRAVLGIISLPSERTLSDYTHWTAQHSGLQLEYIKELHHVPLPSHQHQVALSIDEMKINFFCFQQALDALVGFVDLGSVHLDIEKVVCGQQSESSTSDQLATQTFLVIARAVF